MGRRYVKVPIIMQMEEVECGAACLSMIYAYYGKWVTLAQMRSDCGVSRDGSNARRLVTAARNQGMEARGYRYEPEDLKRIAYPCILHWNFNHFVVLCGFKGNIALINDPSRGFREVTMEELDASFTGVCLALCPTEDFVADGKRPSMLEFARRRLEGAGSSLLFCTLGIAIFTAVGIIRPVLNRVFIDRILEGDSGWLIPFLCIMFLVISAQLLVMAVVTVQSIKISGKFAVTANSSYVWHVLRLPMEFFAQRNVGDINSRKNDNEEVAEVLMDQLAPIAVNGVMLILYLLMMLNYSKLLTVIGVSTVLLNAVVSYQVSKKRIAITQVKMRSIGKLNAVTVSGMGMMETIKSSGSEDGFFAKWAGYQAALNTAHAKNIRLDNIYGNIPDIISNLSGIVIQMLGIYLIMSGEFTVGMLMAFQGFLNNFASPASSLISSGTMIQEMRSSMERIDDVMNYEPDVKDSAESGEEPAEYKKLKGTVELSHVTFGYNKLAKPLVKDFSLTIRQGERIALVGASGCGKSTISKLVTGLYTPWSGQVRIGDCLLSDIPRDVLTGSLSVVDQDIVLFEDTIANNIKMWDTSIEDFEMILAAKDAQIHDDIMQREEGYNTMILEHGANFSGGQRQRMEIARVLAGDPTVIIMDEATSALDAKTEHEVVKAINTRGITCIIVAHRLSTIRDCDQILVLDHGTVVEQGTHEELLEMGGYYTKLVKTE